MPLEQAEREQIVKDLTEALTPVISDQVNFLTNKYDKSLEKKVLKYTEPLVKDLAAAKSKTGENPGGKKLARMLLENGIPIEKVREMGLTPGKKFEKKLGAEIKEPLNAEAKPPKQFDDPKGKKDIKLLLARVERLEEEKKAAEKRASESEVDSELNMMLSPFEWAKSSSQRLAFKEIRQKVQRDPDTLKLVIDDADAESWIKANVPEEYDYLLAQVNKGGAGLQRSTGKPKGVDIDDIAGKSVEETAKFAREVAAKLGA